MYWLREGSESYLLTSFQNLISHKGMNDAVISAIVRVSNLSDLLKIFNHEMESRGSRRRMREKQ